MGTTNNFGLQKFGPEGRISDNSYKFSLKDRELIDSLLWTLFNHDHSVSVGPILQGPSTPTGTLTASGGSFPAAFNLYYRISYVDGNGNETIGSTPIFVRTPDPIPPPEAPILNTVSTGGALESGTYRYALGHYVGGTVTRAPNVSTLTVPTGTTTNVNTITLPAIHDDAEGWKLYRRGPLDAEYYLLATIPAPAVDYVDDGGTLADCTKKRPTSNTTNSNNSVTINISVNDLPLDSRIKGWRIYRGNNAGVFGASSLLATVTNTTTEGGSDLVTSYVDVGGNLSLGSPLIQTAVPPDIPQLSVGTSFAAGGYLPAEMAPQGIRQLSTFLPGTLSAQTYNQWYCTSNMRLERIDAYFIVGPTGVSGTDNVVIRIKDDSLVDEVQSLWNDTEPVNEVQRISNDATAGTFTLSFDGQGPTNPIAYDATGTTIKTELELLSNITEVDVFGTGRTSDPWVVIFLNPGGQNVPQMTHVDSLTGGSTTISTSIDGSDGGTFTLSDGTDETMAIAYNATAGTIETRLETDITSIVDVTVTGAGTEADPWIITFVNPGSQNIDLLIPNDTNMPGDSFIEEVERGRGNTIVDLTCATATNYFFWQSSTTKSGVQNADSAPATGGTAVSDSFAHGDSAMELDTQFETNSWTIGSLDAGDYVFNFEVSDTLSSAAFTIRVVDVNGPTTLESLALSNNRFAYLPAYSLEVTLDGTEDVRVEVEKTDATTDPVRIDRYSYEVLLPVLYQGQFGTAEVLVNGTPTTNGDDVQLSVWY